MLRLLGTLLILTALAIGAIGVLWTVFAIVGTEWDYCPGHGHGCIRGELVGLALLAVGVLVGWAGVRLASRS